MRSSESELKAMSPYQSAHTLSNEQRENSAVLRVTFVAEKALDKTTAPPLPLAAEICENAVSKNLACTPPDRCTAPPPEVGESKGEGKQLSVT